jgi:outer membrane protein OmpA-like peptidoglycan-associated protein
MGAQRRETDRETTGAVQRMWQTYADQIGIPAPVATDEPLRREGEAPASHRRPMRAFVATAGPVLAVVGVIAVAVMAVTTVWRGSPSMDDAAARRATTLASAPAGEAEPAAEQTGPTEQPAPTGRASDTPVLSAAVPAPSETGERAGRQPEPDASVARPLTDVTPPSPVTGPVTKPVEPAASAETRPERRQLVSRINFDFATDDIDARSKRALDKVVAAMDANPRWRLTIEGHTEALGTPDYNLALSERRARAVRKYLEAAGVAPQRLTAVGFGASRPAAPNDVLGNALNRRVELHRR